MSKYEKGDDCMWSHCSTIATCPCCRKDDEIERLTAENKELDDNNYIQAGMIAELRAALDHVALCHAERLRQAGFFCITCRDIAKDAVDRQIR